MKIILSITILLISLASHAQSEIDPTSGSYTFKMEPFSVVYSQLETELFVTTSHSVDRTIYNVVMSMPDIANQSRVITDVIGVAVKDGSFIYRDFHFPMPSWKFNRVRYDDQKISIESFSASGTEKEERESTKPVFDGTFVYWQLAGVAKSADNFVINRWKQSSEGLVVGMSAASFRLEGKKDIKIGEDTYNCRVYAVEAAPGTKVICYVSDQAPYLIKQEYQEGDTDPVDIMVLSRVLK